MTNRKVRDRIRLAWASLERACDHGIETERLLYRAIQASRAQEKGHRRFAPHGHRHPQSVETVARYFVIREATRREDPPAPESWSRAASYREDIALAWALRERLRDYGLLEPLLGVVEELDYCRDISRTAT